MCLQVLGADSSGANEQKADHWRSKDALKSWVWGALKGVGGSPLGNSMDITYRAEHSPRSLLAETSKSLSYSEGLHGPRNQIAGLLLSMCLLVQ